MIERIALSAEAAAVGRGDDANVRAPASPALWPAPVQDNAASACSTRSSAFPRDLCAPPPRAARWPDACCPERRKCLRRLRRHRRSLVSTSAEFQRHTLVNVALFAVIVNARLGSSERFFRIGNCRQDFVFDVNQIERFESGQVLRARSPPPPDRPRAGRDRTHSACSSWLTGRIPYWIGKSFPVSTRYTPGCASAREVSILRMRACGCGERSNLQYAMRRQKNIVGKARLPGHFGARVHSAPRHADDAQFFRLFASSFLVGDIRRIFNIWHASSIVAHMFQRAISVIILFLAAIFKIAASTASKI